MSSSRIPERPQKNSGVPSRPQPVPGSSVPGPSSVPLSRPVPVNPGFPVARPNVPAGKPGKKPSGSAGKKPKKPLRSSSGSRKPPLWLWVVFGVVIVGFLAAAVWFVVGLFGSSSPAPEPVPTDDSIVETTPIVTSPTVEGFLMIGQDSEVGAWLFMPEFVSGDTGMITAVTDPELLVDVNGLGECSAAAFILPEAGASDFQTASTGYMEQYLAATGSTVPLGEIPAAELTVPSHSGELLPAYSYQVPGGSTEYENPQTVLLVHDQSSPESLMGFQFTCSTQEAADEVLRSITEGDLIYGLTFGSFTL